MKWYNSNKTECLDLSKIVYWKYMSKFDAEEYNRSIKYKNPDVYGAFYPILEQCTNLEVYIGNGDPITFKGSDAEEIYKLLTTTKEVL